MRRRRNVLKRRRKRGLRERSISRWRGRVQMRRKEGPEDWWIPDCQRKKRREIMN